MDLPAKWPACCGRPCWLGPHGFGCWTCDRGKPRPVETVDPVDDAGWEQGALF